MICAYGIVTSFHASKVFECRITLGRLTGTNSSEAVLSLLLDGLATGESRILGPLSISIWALFENSIKIFKE